MGTRFRNLWEKLGVAGDQLPREDRGEPDEEEEDVGEYIAKLCLNDDSRAGKESLVKMSFSSSIETSAFGFASRERLSWETRQSYVGIELRR